MNLTTYLTLAQVAYMVFVMPLSMYHDQVVPSWFRFNPSLVVSIHHLAELFHKAFVQAATVLTAVNYHKHLA